MLKILHANGGTILYKTDKFYIVNHNGEDFEYKKAKNALENFNNIINWSESVNNEKED